MRPANAGLLGALVTPALSNLLQAHVHSGSVSWYRNLRQGLALAHAPRLSLPQTDEGGRDAGSRQPQLVDAIMDHPAGLVCLRTGRNTASASLRMTIPRGQQCPEPANQVSFLLRHENFHERTPSAELPSRAFVLVRVRGRVRPAAAQCQHGAKVLVSPAREANKNQVRERRTRVDGGARRPVLPCALR